MTTPTNSPQQMMADMHDLDPEPRYNSLKAVDDADHLFAHAAPPQLARQAAGEPVAAPPPVPPAAPAPGVAGGLKEFPLGAGLAHVPVALLVDEELSTLHDPKHAAGPGHFIVVCDRSPSMALLNNRPDAERCAAVLAAEVVRRLPAKLADMAAIAEPHCPTITPVCFAGGVGWTDDDDQPYEEFDTTEARIKAMTVGEVNRNTARFDACEGVIGPLVGKLNETYALNANGIVTGSGTNIIGALRWGERAGRILCEQHGGYAVVILITDGDATVPHGCTASDFIRGCLEDDRCAAASGAPFGSPVSFAALMVGNEVQPKALKELIGTKGMLAYAQTPPAIESALDTLIKPFVERPMRALDTITFTRFLYEDAASDAGTVVCSLHHHGPLHLAENREALFEVAVPPEPRGPTNQLPPSALRVEVLTGVNLLDWARTTLVAAHHFHHPSGLAHPEGEFSPLAVQLARAKTLHNEFKKIETQSPDWPCTAGTARQPLGKRTTFEIPVKAVAACHGQMSARPARGWWNRVLDQQRFVNDGIFGHVRKGMQFYDHVAAAFNGPMSRRQASAVASDIAYRAASVGRAGTSERMRSLAADVEQVEVDDDEAGPFSPAHYVAAASSQGVSAQ